MSFLSLHHFIILIVLSYLHHCVWGDIPITISSDNDGSIDKIINNRLQILRKIGESNSKSDCRKDVLITVEEYPYGRSGNNMLEMVHGLWMAEVLNGSIRIPHFMKQRILNPFRGVSILNDHFCVSNHMVRFGRQLHVRAGELLNIWMVFKYDRFKNMNIFPSFTRETVEKAANIYIRVMSLLWSNPSEDIVKAGTWLIKNKLGNNLNYTAVHKRYMEGECPDIYRRMSNISDFSPDEIPMNHKSWKTLSNLSHPLCSMDLDFVQLTQKLSHRENQRIFLAYDGYGSIEEYKKVNAINSGDLDFSLFPMFESLESRKFLDMFLAIHADFFVLNPRSTYSWYVYVVRTALGLTSVPIIKNRDLLFYSDEDYNNLMDGNRWVSQLDIHNQVKKLVDAGKIP